MHKRERDDEPNFGSILDEDDPRGTAKPAPSLKKEQLARLIRLLSSPVDGERLGAVCGIERILRSAGLSFHELAAAVLASSLNVDESVGNARSWIDAGNKLLGTDLRDHERKFVRDMISRFESQPHGFKPTEKQTAWFVSLWKRELKEAA
jgi:hypothetical protein